MRIGIVDRAQLEPIDPHVAAVFEDAIERLSDTFASNETVRLPLDLSEYRRLSGEIMAFEAIGGCAASSRTSRLRSILLSARAC
jgi:Asp-tRNA(Asn)/Glu-tRNA(Gln) amidotransferase A subunit family amidase